jgi:hypothetical protein
MKKIKFTLMIMVACMLFSGTALAGPYAPAAGLPGSTAISKDDPSIVGWATDWTNYVVGSYDNDPSTPVDPTWQTPEKALGPAVGTSFDIVTLGRDGEITMLFDKPIRDGAGWDFAVFENGFSDTFLELGYVEVSSDGTNFFRFDNDSLTPGLVGGFGAVDPTNIIGLGSKYRQGFGEPYDLADLAGTPGLDVNNVGFVKIIDILGDGSFLDTSGNPIYDPTPTVGSPGFDLDAVGVLNQVPIPGAVWLLGGGLLALIGIRRRSANN